MFGSGIGIGGLGSGLNTAQIIQQLVQLETIPLQQIQVQKKDEQDKVSAVGKLKNLVKELQSAAQSLAEEDEFLEFNVATAYEGVAKISASGSAQIGSHTITVNQVASIDRWAFDGVTDPEANLATGAGQQVNFTAGGTNYAIAVDLTSSSLEDIAAEINEAASDDVEATVVNAGTSTSPSWRLVLTSKASGEDGRITNLSSSVGGLVADGTGATVDGDPLSRNHLTVGLNALAEIDGLLVERSTNDFNDVIEGLSITVESADDTLEMGFSVQPDTGAVKEKIQELVDSYNKVINFINQQNTYSEDTGPGGDLFGDSVLSAVRRQIDSALFDVDTDNVVTDTVGYSTMSLVGIKKLSDGTLQIDATKFDEKLEQNLSAFMDLFVDRDGFDNGGAAENTPGFYTDTTADSGLAAKLDRSIERMLVTAAGPDGLVLKGLFDAKNEALGQKIKRFDDQIEKKQFYLERYENQLIERFAKLEDIMGGLNSQGAALQAALAGLNG